MASASSSLRRGEEVAQISANANPIGWISDEEVHRRLKAEGLHSHIYDSDSNIWLTKREIYRDCLRYPGRHNMDKLYLHNGLNKEEKMVVYVLAWLLLPERFLHERMTVEDIFLLNDIKTRIPTNWVVVLKDHMIGAGDNHGHNLPYGVFISKVLVLQGVNVSEEDRHLCNKSHEIGKAILTCIRLKRNVNDQFFKDEQTFVTSLASPPISDEDQSAFIP
ncbi:hypothetical protein LR48_Vigan09g004600 [Vigna angularis]|uniref:Uncharacterized protein n=1 Tax=Phaseolus angularis TaxID=3914 RepID=A0A0L9V912_PHAAN|nr:hypothetical protein LR48_Vigan09g004600 [Vigna angularis]